MKDLTKYLITGGAGSLGQELVAKIFEKLPTANVVVYDYNENSVAWMNKFKPDLRMKLVLGDVNDIQKLDYAMEDVDVCVHGAYAKHVDFCETDPLFGLKTNIEGTMNTITSALRNNVKKFVFISSDKAVYPISIYGKSKSLCESIVLRSYHYKNKKKTVFAVVRPPNYIGSVCSVLQIWEEQKKRGKPVTVTHKDMERYFMSFEDMTIFILDCIADMKGGELFIPTKIKRFKILDLAKKVSDDIIFTGIREGERLKANLMTLVEQKKAKRKGSYWVLKS